MIFWIALFHLQGLSSSSCLVFLCHCLLLVLSFAFLPLALLPLNFFDPFMLQGCFSFILFVYIHCSMDFGGKQFSVHVGFVKKWQVVSIKEHCYNNIENFILDPWILIIFMFYPWCLNLIFFTFVHAIAHVFAILWKRLPRINNKRSTRATSIWYWKMVVSTLNSKCMFF